MGRKSELSTHLTEVDTTDRNICVLLFLLCASVYSSCFKTNVVLEVTFFQRASVGWIASVKRGWEAE